MSAGGKAERVLHDNGISVPFFSKFPVQTGGSGKEREQSGRCCTLFFTAICEIRACGSCSYDYPLFISDSTGEIPQYYVEEHHEAIIPPDLFDFVQSEIKRREQNGKHSGVSIFANKIKCGCCGSWYGAKVWHSTDKYRRVIYRCNKKYAHKGKPCGTRHLTEEEIKQIFVKALNSLVEVKEKVIVELQSLIDGVCWTGELTEEHDRIEQELGVLAERLETLIHENARVAQDQTAYLKQENEIRALYVEKQGHLARLDEQIAEREGKRKTLETMIQVVYGINGEQSEFDEDLWGGLLDHIVVKGDGAVVVFKGGIEIGIGG